MMSKHLNVKVETDGTKPPSTRMRFYLIGTIGRPSVRTPKFEGCWDDLKGYVFD